MTNIISVANVIAAALTVETATIVKHYVIAVMRLTRDFGSFGKIWFFVTSASLGSPRRSQLSLPELLSTEECGVNTHY